MKEMKWTPITEGMPPMHYVEYEDGNGMESGRLIVCGEHDGIRGSYESRFVIDDAFEGWQSDDGASVENVTHWMPWPELPEAAP